MAGREWQGTAMGIAIGIGIGVAVGILLAPKSGQETRGQIADAVKDGVDQVVSTGQDLASRAQQTLGDAREQLEEATEAGEQAYRKAKSTAS